MKGTDLRLSPKTREVLDWLDARRRTPDVRYNPMVGVSDESDNLPAGPAVPAYSRTAGPSHTHGSKT